MRTKERGRYRRGVFLVVYRKDKDKIEYLLLKRKLHWKGWEFPKGGCKRGETEKQCCLREIEEETGVKPAKIEKYNKMGEYDYKRKLRDREGIIGQTYLLFSAQVETERVKIDRTEHSEFKWAEFNDAMKMLTWQNQRECLKVVHEKLENS